jgi:hypothetical protein
VNTTGDQTIDGNKTFNNDITVVGKVITDTLVNRTVAQLTVSGSIFPSATSSQKDIGATANRWANLWLSGNATIWWNVSVTGSVTAGSFAWNGASLTALTAANISAGTAGISITGNAATASAVPWSWVTGKPTTIAGYGITDFVSSNSSSPVGADATTTNGHYYVNANISQFGQADGALYVQWYSSSWASQIYQDYRTGQLAIRGKNNGTWQSWRTILDSTNFTSYTPSLTGGWASGNWNINAATASAVPWSWVTGKPTTIAGYGITNAVPQQDGARYTTDLNTILTSGLYNMEATPTNSPAGAAYGSMLVARGIDTGMQLYGWYNNDLWHRGWWSSGGGFSSWSKILSSSNFTSYAPSLTGGWASGTWGISITGNAATATNATTVAGITPTQIFNNMGQAHSTQTDFNTPTDFGPRFIQWNTNAPGTGTQYYNIWLGLGSEYPYSQYAMQFAIPRNSATPYASVRFREWGAWWGWSKIYAGFADSATNSTQLGWVAASSYALLASPALSGTPTAPTAAAATNNTQIATTAFVSNKLPFQSARNFPSGTLIQSDIDYSVTNGDPWFLEIEGNSYGSLIPFEIKYQGYIYSDTIINHGWLSNGTNITWLVAFNYGGKLCFWFPYQSYWHGYTVNITDSNSGVKRNRLVSVTDVAKPGWVTKEVALSANIRQSLHSSNFTSYAPSLTGGWASGTWGINITGNADTVDSLHAASFMRSDAANTVWSANLFGSNKGAASTVGANSTYWLQAYASDGGAAAMSFHRSGQYAVNMGLDPDNVLRIGWWSAAANRWQLDMSGNQTVAWFLRAGTNVYTDQNYGYGLVGAYSATRYQWVYAMGDAYKLAADGTSPGSLYGIAWTHTNIGGESKAWLGHQALFMENGVTQTAIGNGIWTRAAITALWTITAPNYHVTAANGNGLCFWSDCTNYKISMANTSDYQYGPVTGYSIKNTMNNQAWWGWTWGTPGATPVAALSTAGNMQIAGNFGIGATPAAGSLQIASTPTNNFSNIFFGASAATSGVESAALTFAGNGIQHAGFGWIPNSTTNDSRLSLFMWGNADPAQNTPMMSFLGNGNVGIGTTSPTAALTVSGNVIANTPTASNHVATKAYVDAAVAAGWNGDGTQVDKWFPDFSLENENLSDPINSPGYDDNFGDALQLSTTVSVIEVKRIERGSTSSPSLNALALVDKNIGLVRTVDFPGANCNIYDNRSYTPRKLFKTPDGNFGFMNFRYNDPGWWCKSNYYYMKYDSSLNQVCASPVIWWNSSISSSTVESFVHSSGKVYVLFAQGSNTYVERYNSNCTLDTTFGTSGRSTFSNYSSYWSTNVTTPDMSKAIIKSSATNYIIVNLSDFSVASTVNLGANYDIIGTKGTDFITSVWRVYDQNLAYVTQIAMPWPGVFVSGNPSQDKNTFRDLGNNKFAVIMAHPENSWIGALAIFNGTTLLDRKVLSIPWQKLFYNAIDNIWGTVYGWAAHLTTFTDQFTGGPWNFVDNVYSHSFAY